MNDMEIYFSEIDFLIIKSNFLNNIIWNQIIYWDIIQNKLNNHSSNWRTIDHSSVDHIVRLYDHLKRSLKRTT